MSEDYDPLEDVYNKLNELYMRIEKLEEMSASKVAPSPAPAPAPPPRGYVKPKVVQPDTIASLRDDDKNLTLDATIVTIGNRFTFTKKNGEQGSGCRILVGDHTAQIYLVLWNDQVDLVDTLMPNQSVTLHNVYTKRSPKNVLELQLDKNGSITPRQQVIL